MFRADPESCTKIGSKKTKSSQLATFCSLQNWFSYFKSSAGHYSLFNLHSQASNISTACFLKHPSLPSWSFGPSSSNQGFVSKWPLSLLRVKVRDQCLLIQTPSKKLSRHLTPSQEKGKSHLENPSIIMTATNCQLLMAPNLTARLQQGLDLLGKCWRQPIPQRKG